MTDILASIVYTSVFSKKMVHVALMIVDLNDLEVKAEDILNAYLHRNITEYVPY